MTVRVISQLHIVRQPAIKDPVLHRADWTTKDIAAAFDKILDYHLEPFGLESSYPRPRSHPPDF